jgi:hypothetical protein
MTLQGIMQQAEVKDERWQQRYDHIPVYAKSAVEKSSFDDEELDVDYEYPDVNEERTDNFPWPPGYLGELALSVKHFQHFKNDTLAVITALGVVAGVSGRQFNISNTGLNLYLTILMDSGMGKDSVQKYITKFLIEFNELGNALSFLGPKRYTGPKALYAALKKQRCLVSVLTEAAFILNASSGDQEGLTRAMLDLYTKSGHGDYVAGEAYSKEDESVEAMHSPSFSVISESTAEVYIEVLKTRQSAETGELGRMIVHYLGGKKPYLNRNQKFEISQNLREHFKSLLNSCILSVTQETNKVTPIAIPDAYWDFADWCVDMEMEHKHSNRVYSMSFSRMAIKALKLAALCAIMNPDTQRGEVSCTDWEWAVSACKFEASRLANLFHSTGSSDLDDLVATVVKPAIIKIISRTPKHENQKIPRGLSEKGVFTYSPLHQLTRASEPLKRLQNVRAGLSPLQMVLTHMVNIGLLRKIENPMEANRLNIETSGRKADKRAVFYQLTRETIELWSLQTKPKAVNPG